MTNSSLRCYSCEVDKDGAVQFCDYHQQVITRNVHPDSLAEPKRLVDEIDDLLSEAIGYDYTNRGPAMIALERLVERNSAPVGPSLTDAIEVVKRLRANIENEPENNGYESALNDAITTLESLQGKAPETALGGESYVRNCIVKGRSTELLDPLFRELPNGQVIVKLDGYAVIPKEEYLRLLEKETTPLPGEMYEDQLPADMPKEDYDKWYAQSRLSGGSIGVRVGPRYPFAS